MSAQYVLLVGTQLKSTAQSALPAHSERILQQWKQPLLTLAFHVPVAMQEQVKLPLTLATVSSALQAGYRVKRLGSAVRIVQQVLTRRGMDLICVQTVLEANTQR